MKAHTFNVYCYASALGFAAVRVGHAGGKKWARLGDFLAHLVKSEPPLGESEPDLGNENHQKNAFWSGKVAEMNAGKNLALSAKRGRGKPMAPRRHWLPTHPLTTGDVGYSRDFIQRRRDRLATLHEKVEDLTADQETAECRYLLFSPRSPFY